MADNTNNSNPQQDIIDNLLVKEEAGNLHYFQEGKNKSQATSSPNVSTTSPTTGTNDDKQKNVPNLKNEEDNKIALAPDDDSFSREEAQGSAKDKSDLVFHPEDKMQIVRLSESVPVDDSKKYSIEKIIDKLVSKQNLKLDDTNRSLFTNLILDFFRNRKSAIAIRELLATKIISEEKTLAAEIVDSILSVIKSLKLKIDGEGGLVVGADEMKKEEPKPKIAPIPIKKDKIEKIAPKLEVAEVSDKAIDSNIPQNIPVVEQTGIIAKDDSEIEIEKIAPKFEASETLEKEVDKKEVGEIPDGIVAPVKFGEEPKGIEEVEKDDVAMGQVQQEEIDESLAEIKNIIPNMATGTKTQEDEEEAQLLRELALDNNKIAPEGTSSASQQEDLHDIGQLMMEDTDDKKEVEEEEDGFVIQKVKPAGIPSDDSEDVAKPDVEIKKAPEEINKVNTTEEVKTNIATTPPTEEVSATDNKPVENISADLTELKEEVKTNIATTPPTEEVSATDNKPVENISADLTELKEEVKTNIATTPPTEEVSATDNKPVENISADPTELKKVSPVEETQKKPEKDSLPRVVRPGQTFSAKQQVSDVQEVPTNTTPNAHVLTGPVEELNGMTLKSFRFLGTNAQDRANKILEKINILEQDSYTKKVAGVKGWRNSPVNKLYLNLGAEGMSAGKDINVLINEKKVAGEEVLDMEEFVAISDINKSLRF